MNEQRFAYLIRQALEESSDRLPYRVTQRLERARHTALARAPETEAVQPLMSGRLGAVALHGSSGRPSLRTRVLSIALPLLILAAGFYGIAMWSDLEDAADTADIDAALVLGDDDIPVSALADKGFGVFLRNTRQ
jgi:hypothetical protein